MSSVYYEILFVLRKYHSMPNASAIIKKLYGQQRDEGRREDYILVITENTSNNLANSNHLESL